MRDALMIGVLVPFHDGDPGAPEDRPIGRAALQLEAEGQPIVFGCRADGGRLWGARARPGRWEPVQAAPIAAAYDRFPSQSRPEVYRELRRGLGSVPVANPESLVLLCRDKLATQAALDSADIAQPPVESDPGRFAATLEHWGVGYLKPRYGAFGRGVRRVVPGDPLPAEGEGALEGVLEPLFLQRGVPPPVGWAGVTCRVLVQRTPDDRWHVEVPVARRSRTDPVVNASRGADVVPLATAAPRAVGPTQRLARAAATALAQLSDGQWLVEVGVDVALDTQHRPHLIEVNSRPRGRLQALAVADAEQWQAAHVDACARPLRTLAARVRAEREG